MTRAALARRRMPAQKSYDPASLFGSALAGWWRADDLSGLADGAGVASWSDRTANGNTLTQATTARQPTKQTDAAGTFVRFASASTQYLQKSAPTGLTAAPNDLTVIAVYRPTTQSGPRAVLDYSSGSGSGNGFIVGALSGQLMIANFFVYNNLTTGPLDNELNMCQWEMRATDPRVACAHANKGPLLTGNSGFNAGANMLTVGRRNFTTEWYLNGDIYELIYLNRRMTAAERLALARRYMKPRYGFTVAPGTNPATPCVVPTYDGSNEPIHPDVYVSPTTWNGKKYWMAFTPWPDDPTENPSIVCSDDNVTYAPPAGLTNPIEPWNGITGQYNSDTDLLMSPDGTTLHCTFRTVAGTETIYVKSSTDGVNWSAKTAILTASNAPSGTTIARMLSPALQYFGGKYWLWAVREPASGSRAIDYYQANAVLGPWAYVGTTNITNVPVLTAPFAGGNPGLPWHIDVTTMAGQLWMVINDTKNLFAATSTDGITWKVFNEPIVLLGLHWDRTQLYRASCFPGDDNQSLRVWYSGKDKSDLSGGWEIGYLEIPLTDIV